jgi:C_GCAxxG_C_C family probable redox protein
MKLEHYPREAANYSRRDEKPGSEAKVLDRLAKAAYDNNRAYEGCARCVLHALQTHLSIVKDEKTFEGAMAASTALSAGVGRQGETCGALLGALMAVGLVQGTTHLNDFDGYVDTMTTAAAVFEEFKKRHGTVKCSDIQETLFGRRIDFFKSEDAEFWYENGGLDKCPGICAEAARIAGEAIIRIRRNSD